MVKYFTNKTICDWRKKIRRKRSHAPAVAADVLIYILNEGQHMAIVLLFL